MNYDKLESLFKDMFDFFKRFFSWLTLVLSGNKNII